VVTAGHNAHEALTADEVCRVIGERVRELCLGLGLTMDTVAGAAAAGANVLVSGSALYRDPAGLEHAVTDLRQRAEAARA
jgi:ribulose-phosphate 3-epimerase